MEVSALKYSGPISLHGRLPLLRLQSDERLIALIRRGNHSAFEALVARYEARLLAFCRHLLASREDAEDVLQEVMAAAFNAIVADERPINVRPWLYRIARNRSLNHLRRMQAVGFDSMDVHFSENGATTADKVHDREEFRLLVDDIQDLPETQRTALVLREMDALSYEQIAEAMDTTVPSVKSLLVRARVSLAEAAEARLLSCDAVRIELGEVAEGLRRRPTPLVRRHLRACKRCATFRTELKRTNRALAALMPVAPLGLLKQLLFAHLGHGAGAGSGAAGTGAAASSGAAGAGSLGAGAGSLGAGAGSLGAGAAGAGSLAVAGSTGGFVSAGVGALATKAAAGLAAAALVTAGAVDIDHSSRRRPRTDAVAAATPVAAASAPAITHAGREPSSAVSGPAAPKPTPKPAKPAKAVKDSTAPTADPAAAQTTPTTTTPAPTTPPGRTATQSDPTVLPPQGSVSGQSAGVPQLPPPSWAPGNEANAGASSAGTTPSPSSSSPPPATSEPPSTPPPSQSGPGQSPSPPADTGATSTPSPTPDPAPGPDPSSAGSEPPADLSSPPS